MVLTIYLNFWKHHYMLLIILIKIYYLRIGSEQISLISFLNISNFRYQKYFYESLHDCGTNLDFFYGAKSGSIDPEILFSK